MRPTLVTLIVEDAFGEKHQIRAENFGQAFGRATEIAGVSAVDELGERYLWFFDGWVVWPRILKSKGVDLI